MSILGRMMRRVRSIVRARARRDDLEREMAEEMRLHLELEASDLARAGLDPAEASRRAAASFGGVEWHKESARDGWGLRWLDELAQDVRYTLRTLRRARGFTAVAVLTVALGIGATTAIFSAVRGVLLRPLAYRDPGRVVRLLGTTTSGDRFGTVAYLDVMDFAAQSRTLDVAVYDEWTPTLEGGEAPERVDAGSVTSAFFRVLGVQPALGRFFLPEEDSQGHAPAVVLSYGLWQRRHGGDPAIVGKTIRASGVEYTVVGVTRPDFEDPDLSGGPYEPAVLWRVTPPYFNPRDATRGSRSFAAIGRLRPGATLESAQAELASIARRLELQYPESNTGRGVRVVSLKEKITAPVRPALLVLLGATGLLVLVACANLANLLLARGATRQREMALRTALGAGRRRLLRQLITESLVLAMLGGSLGLVLGWWATNAMVAVAGDALARADRVHADALVAAFALGATLLTGLLFGIAPALQSARTDPHAALKEGGRGTAGPSAQRFRSTLIAAEVAISLVLLASAGLLIRSLWRLERVDPGFRPEGVLTFEVSPPFARYGSDSALVALYDRMTERLRAIPGVRAVGTIDLLPMGGNFNGMGVAFPHRPKKGIGQEPGIETRSVTPGFFAAFGVPLLRGRDFTERDGPGAPDVAIIDEAMARQYWPGEDPIGRELIVYDSTHWRVVGVVGSIRNFTLDRTAEPTLYLPRRRSQEWVTARAVIVMRTTGDPAALARDARTVLRDLDREIPLSRVSTAIDVVGATLAPARLRTTLLALFAALAFAIGAVGIYGVIAYAVSRRTTELGIRMALGARAREILSLVMAQGLRPVVVGLALGLALALAAGRLLAGMLYGVSATDPLAFAGAILCLLGAAILAAYIPARRATKIDPAVALRTE